MQAVLAAVQMKGRSGDVGGNLMRASEILEGASRGFIEGRTVICLPELFATGYDLRREMFMRIAESAAAKTMESLSGLAVRFGAYIHAGVPESGEGERLHDSSVLISPRGKVVGKYRKMYLAGEHEKGIFTPGEGGTVVETSIGPMGLMICYDQVFPEVARRLSTRGAEIVLHSSAWSDFPREMDWGAKDYMVFAKARAMENTVFLVSSNRTGREGRFAFVGQTSVIAPWGAVLAHLDRREGCAVAKVDLGLLNECREMHPCLKELKTGPARQKVEDVRRLSRGRRGPA